MLEASTLGDYINLGSIAIVAIIFLIGFIWGVLRGRRKVLLRIVYVIIFLIASIFFVPFLLRFILDVNLGVLIDGSLKDFALKQIATEEEIQTIIEEVPVLSESAFEVLIAFIAPIFYVIFVWIGLILFFPLYILYLFIAKKIFKIEKYEKEYGKYVKNEKGKKVKAKYKKHRLTAGLIRGFQGVLVFSIVFMPLNAISRLHDYARDEAGDISVSLCESIPSLNEFEEVCEYLDMYHNTLLGRSAKYNYFDKFAFGSLTKMDVGESSFNLEEEVQILISSAIYLEKSNMIELLANEDKIDETSFANINSNYLSNSINKLLQSNLISNVVVGGVNYAITLGEEELKETLQDDNVDLNLSYNVESFRKEVSLVVDILKVVLDNDFASLAGNEIKDEHDALELRNSVSKDALFEILDNIIELEVLKQVTPYLSDIFFDDLDNFTRPSGEIDFNNEKQIIKNIIELVYSIDSVDYEDLINEINEHQFELLGSIFNHISSSNIFGNMIPQAIELGLSESLENFVFDVSIFNESDWEEEFEHLYSSFDNLRESNVLDVLADEDFDFENIKYVELDFEMFKQGILDVLETENISTLMLELFNFGISENITLIEESLDIESGQLEISYTKQELKGEVGTLVEILKITLEEGFFDKDFDVNFLGSIKEVEQSVYNDLIDHLVDSKLTKEILPHALYSFGSEWGVKLANQEDINWEVEKNILKDMVNILFSLSSVDDIDIVFDDLDEVVIQDLGSLLDGLSNSSILYDVLPTSIPLMLEDFLNKKPNVDAQVIRDVESWEDELFVLKNLFDVYKEYEDEDNINNLLMASTIDDMQQSDLIITLMDDLAFFAIDATGQNIEIPEQMDWHQELDYYKIIFENLDEIGQFDDIDVDVLNEEIKRNALGNVLDASFASELFGEFVRDLFKDAINPVMDPFGIKIDNDDIDNVDDWGLELKALNDVYIDFVEEGDFNLVELDSPSIESLLDKIESLKLLENHRVSVLVTAIEFAGFMSEQELIDFKAQDKSEVIYEEERVIILNIFVYSDTMSDFGDLDFESVNESEVGYILNNIYGKDDPNIGPSLLLKGYVNNKLLELLPNEVDTNKEELESVPNWEEELVYLSDVASNAQDIGDFENIDFETATLVEIENLGLLLNAGLKSYLLNDQIKDKIVNVLYNNNLEKEKEEVEEVEDWTIELSLIKEITTNDFDINNLETFNIETANEVDIENVGELLNSAFATTLFSDEVADEMVIILDGADIVKTNQEVKEVANWKTELGIVNKALNADSNMTSNEVETLLNDIEGSDLLNSEKERILVEIASYFDTNINPETTTITESEYVHEKALLLDIIEHEDLLDEIQTATYDILLTSPNDLDIIGGIIDDASQSVLFYNLVDDAISELFTNYGIVFVVDLEDGVPWYDELVLLQKINDAAGVVENATDLETLLEDVGNSTVLEESKWDILQDIIDDLGITDYYTIDQSNTWEVESANIVEAYELM